MSKFTNKATGATVSVADEKDGRFAGADWERADAPKAKPPARRTASKTAD
ncbi:MAG: hypothetical protein ABIP03_03570 [Aquihabitans sp.]